MKNREEARKRAGEKAHELVSRMTLEEKASQLRYDAPAIPRLNIPAYNWWNEGLHGVARAGVATSFPQAIGMAATFDTELLEAMGKTVAVEGRAKYNSSSMLEDRDIYKGLTFWSPNVNIFRDPRWGRGHETYGEDPYLTGELGKAYVNGMQGDGEYMTAAACAKHFAVHSGPEALRHKFDARVSEKDLNETYLPAFEKLVKEADVEAVMGAYNRTNGEPCCGSKTLIQDILRDKWGFQGHYVSDCWAIRDFHTNHMVTDTAEESAAMALKNGCDVNCGNTYLHLLKACQEGLVSEDEITAAAERLFTTRFLLGLFEETEYDKIGFDRLECAEHLKTADRASAESAVLLKNNGILPLKKEALRTIGVIGPNADSRAALVGNYHGTSSRYITVLEGIQDSVPESTRVYYSEGCHLFREKVEPLAWRQDRISEAVNVAKNSDVVILCLGLDETLEGEEGDTGNSYASGDKADLLLPQPQRELAEAVIGVGRPVIVLNMTGSAMDLRYVQEHADAVMQIWYPGARGGRTIARLLFGELSPSGKLPVTFYNSAEELPDFEDYSMKGRTYRYFGGKPLYPFGYGLTYGNVTADEVNCGGRVFGAKAGEELEWDTSEKLKLTVRVTNSGPADTGEVVQVYIKAMDSPHATPNAKLCAFSRVFVPGGGSMETVLELGRDAFTVVNEEGEKVDGGGRFLVSVGLGQPDERTLELTGSRGIAFMIIKKEGPRAPKDPQKKQGGFFIMRNKEVAGSVQPDGRGIQFLYMDGGRMLSCARVVGNVKDEKMLELLQTAAGFRKLVSGIGVTVEMEEGKDRTVDFVLQMYGKKDPYTSGTLISVPVPADGAEHILKLADCEWSEDDDIPGQIRFEFPRPGELACVSVKLYLQEGFEAPEEIEAAPVNLDTEDYLEVQRRSLMQTGNPARLQKAIDRARRGEDITIAFIGGSITQGAGAVPINTGCYAYKVFQRLCDLAGRGTEENIHYVKAGVGGTPSELGMLRYERDVLKSGSVQPDIVVVEFAVNDEGDETKGECYDSLVRMILGAQNRPAVILLFAVFDNDWNLQERLSPVGRAYDLPMVSIRDAVVEQFYQKTGAGRVFSKSQFFYDCYHPTNLGHTVMADCVAHLLRTADQMPRQEDNFRLSSVMPPLGGEFAAVKLFDRSCSVPGIRVDCGDFQHTDEELQAVEMDRDLEPTREFPNNWMHRGGTETKNTGRLFSMDITCTALLLIYKDSGSSGVGCADVLVDGRKVLTADPHVNGWTHCNPVICFRGAERKQYHVEIGMAEGDEDREFTILGFGYVE